MPSQTFTSSGTWSCPTDYLPGSAIVMCWGEGGTGGTSVHGSHGGGGGGGGEWAQDTPTVTAGSNYTITIGAGSTGTNTTFVGDNLTVTAHAGGASPGQGAGSGGTGSTNASHFDGGAGGGGSLGSSVSGAGGGGSAGSGSSGGAGNSSGTGGTAGTGTNPGAIGGAGGGSLASGSNGNAPGSGGGGGGSGGSLNHTGGNGAAGQVIVFWQTFVPAPPPMQRRQLVSPQLNYSKLTRSTQAFTPQVPPVNTEAIRYSQHMIAELIRHGRTVAPTGWPVPVQPLFPPGNGERRWTKPPYPRRGVTITPWPSRNIPPTESERSRFKPPYPRKGVVAPTGWPVPVQPPSVPNVGAHRDDRTRRRRPQRGTMLWPGTPAPLIQPPWSSWVYKRRWTKPLFPRKGVVAPEALPPPPLFTPYNPVAERRTQRYQWFRRGNVLPTGWPIPVQPPMTSQSLRRWYKPPWPRKGVQPPTNLPEPVPTSWVMRRPQKYQWFRKGNAQPNTGLPVPVQPPEVPHSVKRIPLRALLPRKQGPKFSAFFIPVQPPERMQAIRRWSRPLWPRRGRTNIATFPGVQSVTGYQLLPLQTFTYTPGGAGLDLGTLGLTLFPLNKLGYTFWNRYGDVVFIVWNNTPLPVAVTPNVIRKVELQSVTLPQYTLQPGIMQAFGPYPPNDFADPQLATPAISYYMTVAIEASSSGVYAGAFRMVNAPPYGHTGPYDVIGLRLVRKIVEHRVNTSSTPGNIHPGETTPGA